MKALSLKQPYASMVASGEKTIETRTWATKYRGPILIVSSMSRDLIARGSRMILGFALCTANLVDCRPMTKADEKDACCEVYPDAVAWILSDVKPIQPFRLKGQLGLFEVPYGERQSTLTEAA